MLVVSVCMAVLVLVMVAVVVAVVTGCVCYRRGLTANSKHQTDGSKTNRSQNLDVIEPPGGDVGRDNIEREDQTEKTGERDADTTFYYNTTDRVVSTGSEDYEMPEGLYEPISMYTDLAETSV